MEDRAIIALYQTRNEQAIRETDAKYGKLCYQIAYNILSRHEDSEECVNDTYVGAWNAIPPAKPTHFRAFLCKITRNLSLKRLAYLRQEKRNQDMAVSLSDLEAILPDDRYAPGLTDADVGRTIESFLWLQKPEVRCVFVRRYYFFDSVAEIAKRYRFTESKVKNMLFQTRNRLKEYLIEEGIEV